MTIIKTSTELDEAIQASHDHPIIIFKHSATCPYSAKAQFNVTRAKHDADIYGIVVQYDKDLSTEIAEKLNVEHASPQAIIVKDGEAIAHYWRSEIKTATLMSKVDCAEDQIAEACKELE